MAQPDRLANQPGALERESGREQEGRPHRGVFKRRVHGQQPTEGEAADKDLVDVAFQRVEPEPHRAEPVPAGHVEQVSRPRAVPRQQHRPDHEAARRERIGQVAHRERHVGQPVQKENSPARGGRSPPARNRRRAPARRVSRRQARCPCGVGPCTPCGVRAVRAFAARSRRNRDSGRDRTASPPRRPETAHRRRSGFATAHRHGATGR